MKPRRHLPLLALLLTAALPAAAQHIPPDPVLRDFEPFGDYLLELAGAERPEVKLYRSQTAGSAVLLVGPGLPGAILLQPRDKSVQRLDPQKVVVGGDGMAFVLSDAQLARESALVMAGRDVTFTLGGKPARLKERPYLLGLHPGRDLVAHDPSYGFRARRYTPSAPVVRALRQSTEPVKVRVFFGNWCPHCSQMVPRILRVAEELGGSKIAFEFYGLPTPFGDEPEAKRLGITGVPSGIVFRNGREIGRIGGSEWSIPELAIKKVIDQAAKASR